MLAMIVGTDVFLVTFMWFMLGVQALPSILFVLGCTLGFSYFNIKDQYYQTPVRVKVGRGGLHFIYRTGMEEEIVWRRIAGVDENIGGRAGVTVVELVDRLIPVAIPVEVVGTLVPLLEKDEEMAEERSTPPSLDPSDPEFKRALRGKNNARKLMILMGASFPFIVTLALVTVFWS